MEIEVKYALPAEETADAIWKDSDLLVISDTASSEILPFLAVYYDTEDRALRKAKLTVRLRSEGSKVFATAKWGGSSKKGLHKREEINIPLPKSAESLRQEPRSMPPDASTFAGTEIEAQLRSLTEGKTLVPLVVMEFTRSRRKLAYEENTIELALDRGIIKGSAGCLPILEMELEHLQGPDPGCVKKLGDELAAKYGLFPENRSKYSRGLTLTGL